MIKYLCIIAIAAIAFGAAWTLRGTPPRGAARTRSAAHRKVEHMATATFGAGCFWGVEQAFRETPGVVATAAGYTGGTAPHPSYEQVCGGRTGHTEAVHVEYDPAQVSYEDLLKVFWTIHDPTWHSKTQYKSVLYYHTPEQQAAAEASKRAQEQAGKRIETEILPAQTFYLAEDYHQQYYEKRGIKGHACGV